MKAPVIIFLLFLISVTGLRSEDKFDSLRVYIQNNEMDKAKVIIDEMLVFYDDDFAEKFLKCTDIFAEEKIYYAVFLVYQGYKEENDYTSDTKDLNLTDSYFLKMDEDMIAVFDTIIKQTELIQPHIGGDEELWHKYDNPKQFYDKYMSLYQEFKKQDEINQRTNDSLIIANPINNQEEKLPPRNAFIQVDKVVSTDMEALGKSITYPKEAKKKGVEGSVYVSIWVDDNGRTQLPKVIKSDSKLLEEEAINAVMNASWKPAMQDGKPVGMWVTVPITFRLKK